MLNIKYFILTLMMFCCNIKSFAIEQVKDTILLKAKVIAIDNYAHIIPSAGRENPYLILLEIANEDMNLIFRDSSYCKPRFVAEYSTVSIENILESNWYFVKLVINKRELKPVDLAKWREDIGIATNCIGFNLNPRWDIQYWILSIAK